MSSQYEDETTASGRWWRWGRRAPRRGGGVSPAPQAPSPRPGRILLPIRVLIPLLVLGPLVLLAGSMLWLSTHTSQRISEDLANALVQSTTARVYDQMQRYLGATVHLSDLYSQRLASERLSAENLDAWVPYLVDDLQASTRISAVVFANARGDTIWALRRAGRLEIGRVDGGAPGQNGRTFPVDPDGKVGAEPIARYRYEVPKRPWYQEAIAQDRPTWSRAYPWFAATGQPTELGTGYVRPIRDARGALQGVLAVDIALAAISDDLRLTPATRWGAVFVVDDDGSVLGTSEGMAVGPDGQQLKLKELASSAAQVAAPLLDGRPEMRRVVLDGEPARVQIAPLRPFQGLDWMTVVVLRESAFLAHARLLQSREWALAIAVVVVALALGTYVARRFTQRLLAISGHLRRLGQGDFSARLNLRTTPELATISDELNRAAEALRHREDLQHALMIARGVQQDLMPVALPPSSRLDVHGVCHQPPGGVPPGRANFLDIGDLPGDRVLIALGRVAGDSAAASLMLASGRAALHGSALYPGTLSVVLDTVNTVLLRSGRGGMSMFLLLLEPGQNATRWASAGAGPGLLYEPLADAFLELPGTEEFLGNCRDAYFPEHSYPFLRPHQILVLANAGLWEMTNARGEPFGHERLQEILKTRADASAVATGDAIEAALAAHHGAPVPATFVVVKVLPVPGPLDG